MDEEARAKLKQLIRFLWPRNLKLVRKPWKILADLLKPGRDLREFFDAPVLRQDVLDLKDLKIGQKLEGVVRNVVDFGAFVDIGIHEDGLSTFHRWVSNLSSIQVKLFQLATLVTVWVYKIDLEWGKKWIFPSWHHMNLTKYVQEVSLEDFGHPFLHQAIWNPRCVRPAVVLS